jgi:hypothetical protein
LLLNYTKLRGERRMPIRLEISQMAPLPIFVGGGGAGSRWYQQTILRPTRISATSTPAYRPMISRRPSDLEMDGWTWLIARVSRSPTGCPYRSEKLRKSVYQANLPRRSGQRYGGERVSSTISTARMPTTELTRVLTAKPVSLQKASLPAALSLVNRGLGRNRPR